MASFVHLIDQRRLIGPGGSTTSGEIYFYYTGTTVKAPIFSDAALLIPLSNPVVVGAGSIIPLIFLNDSIQYRRVIQYADGSIDEQDPIGNLFSDGDIGLPVGSVIDYSGESPPSGFLFCFGQEISRSDYSELFDTIGTQYGPGNGSTTFNLPDYRGRVGAGKDNMGGSAAGRLATQLTGSVLGAVGGAEGHVLTIAQLAAHAHNITITDPGHTHGIPVYGDGNSGNFIEDAGGGTLKTVTSNSATTGITATSANQGSSEAHNNVQPTIVINKIIKTSSVSFLSLFGINLAEEAASAVASIQLAGAAVQAGIENYYGTIAEGVANTPVGDYFASPETGTVRIYQRIAAYPYYQDQGDSVAPVTAGQLELSEAAAAASAAEAEAYAGAAAAALNSSSAPYANAYASTLPKGVLSVTIGGTAITGATVGEYPITGSGGSITGYSLTLVVTSATTATVRVDAKGLGTGTTPPTLTKPAGATLPAGTTLTAVVGSVIADQYTYWVASADSSQVLLYGNNGGSVASAPFGGTQVVLASKATIDARLKFVSVPGGEYAVTFAKPSGPIFAGITNTTGLWDFSGVRTLPISTTAGSLTATISGTTSRSGFLFRCYDSVTKALLFGVQNDGTFVSNQTVAGITAADLSTFLLRGHTSLGSPKTATQNLGKLRGLRSGLTYLKNGNSALVHIILDGDSWWDAKNYGSADAIVRFFADSGLTNAGPGWIGFASPITSSFGPHGAAQNNISVTRTGTWSDLFKSADVSVGTIQNFPGYDAVQSGANGSIYTIDNSIIATCTSITLYCGKGGTVEQSWDGTTYTSVTVPAGSGSTTATIDMTGKTRTLRLRCASGTVIAGIFALVSTSGVVFSNLSNSGSTAAQKATVQSNTDYKAMMASLPGDITVPLIQLGLNDTKAGTANATTVTNVGTIAAGYRSIFGDYDSNDIAILCQPNTPLSVQDTLSPLLRSWAEDNDAAFLDWQPYFGAPASSGDYAAYSRDYTSGSASTALPLLEVSTSYRHPSPTAALISAGRSAALSGSMVVATTLSNLLLSPLRSL